MIAPFFVYMKIKKIANTIVVSLGFALLGWFSFVKPIVLLKVGMFTGVLTYLFLFMGFTPLGRRRLGEKATLSFSLWLWKVIQGQLILLLFTIGAALAFFGKGPAFSQGMTLSFFKQVLTDYMPWQWGIFPWGLIGLYAFLIAYMVYIKKDNPYFYSLARGIYPKRLEPVIKGFVVGGINSASSAAFGVTAVSIILLLSYFLEGLLKVDHLAVPIITISLLSFLCTWVAFKEGRRSFKQVIGRKAHFGKMYVILILLLTFTLLLSAWGNEWILHKIAGISERLQCQQCGRYFALVHPEVRIAAFYWSWWLLWTPLAGSYLARISQGRTLREFLAGILLIPVVLGCLFLLWGKELEGKLLPLLQQIPPLWAYACLGVVGFVVFYQVAKHFKNSSEFVTGYMPDHSVHHNRLWLQDGCKGQSAQKTAPGLLMGMIGMLFLHTAAGWFGIQFQLTVLAVVVIWTIYHGVVFFLYGLSKKAHSRK